MVLKPHVGEVRDLVGMDPAAMLPEAMKLANKIAKGPLNCYSSSKLILNKSFETNLEDLLKEETEAQAAARLHPNGDEGLAAFLEKRKANFQ